MPWPQWPLPETHEKFCFVVASDPRSQKCAAQIRVTLVTRAKCGLKRRTALDAIVATHRQSPLKPKCHIEMRAQHAAKHLQRTEKQALRVCIGEKVCAACWSEKKFAAASFVATARHTQRLE
jgi:hypothetical protein